MMKKIVAVLKVWFFKEDKKISVSKMLATITMFCGLIITLQSQLISAGIAIPLVLMPYFKAVAVISGLIAFIRVRNNQLSDSSTPATPVASDSGTKPVE
jgi:hypothetical protein